MTEKKIACILGAPRDKEDSDNIKNMLTECGYTIDIGLWILDGAPSGESKNYEEMELNMSNMFTNISNADLVVAVANNPEIKYDRLNEVLLKVLKLKPKKRMVSLCTWDIGVIISRTCIPDFESLIDGFKEYITNPEKYLEDRLNRLKERQNDPNFRKRLRGTGETNTHIQLENGRYVRFAPDRIQFDPPKDHMYYME
jgi:hypothetical protein